MDKRIIKDPFMGEIEVIKLGETSMHLMGESMVNTIYRDTRGNLWIDTWTTSGGDSMPMKLLRKELVDKIIEVYG